MRAGSEDAPFIEQGQRDLGVSVTVPGTQGKDQIQIPFYATCLLLYCAFIEVHGLQRGFLWRTILLLPTVCLAPASVIRAKIHSSRPKIPRVSAQDSMAPIQHVPNLVSSGVS